MAWTRTVKSEYCTLLSNFYHFLRSYRAVDNPNRRTALGEKNAKLQRACQAIQSSNGSTRTDPRALQVHLFRHVLQFDSAVIIQGDTIVQRVIRRRVNAKLAEFRAQ